MLELIIIGATVSPLGLLVRDAVANRRRSSIESERAAAVARARAEARRVTRVSRQAEADIQRLLSDAFGVSERGGQR